jgi:hypothetical protein
LLASRTRRGVTTLTSMLDELAAMPGYPDSMVSYYRNRIDSL